MLVLVCILNFVFEVYYAFLEFCFVCIFLYINDVFVGVSALCYKELMSFQYILFSSLLYIL